MRPDVPPHERIFLDAIAIQEPDRRCAFVGAACGTNRALREAVDELVEEHARASLFFEEVAAGLDFEPGPTDDDDGGFEPGEMLGPYRIVRRLGEGGGGVVFEAEQASPVRRRVAIKFLKPDATSRRLTERFELEREMLEVMEHPNIARVLDAGIADDGRPFFVMELVVGTPITAYCRENGLTLATRLSLVQQVCAAVQYAHQKGVIHCDLKPSNILIASAEGVAVPKVIDFGIARAAARVEGRATPNAGTPGYMSPEHRAGAADVDTRTDVYALGVVLHELVTGRLPDVGARPRIDKDLDWILRTATHPDRERRYATLRGLSQDIGRYLANETIAARPYGRAYATRKFVQRNLLASAAVSIGVLALAVGFSVSLSLYFKAQAAERLQAQLRADAEEREHVTRAAIHLLRGEKAEADAEVRRMGGTLTQPSVEATSVFRRLAVWNALSGRWDDAAQRLLALSRVNPFDDADQTDNATRDLLPLAPTLIEAGDPKAYEAFRAMLVDRLKDSDNAVAAEHVLKSCLLLPADRQFVARMERLATVAGRSLGDAPRTLDRMEVWREFALGLWAYRRGDADSALARLTTATDAPSADGSCRAAALAVRGLALRQLGRGEGAARDLAEARTLVDRAFSPQLEFDRQGVWFDWLYARILLREAEK